ncbi:hypothetical protein K440DRAFT_657147 [Wilcoxina mikolae CBS 423.85]|nr:hypothetical protein K440DRAFT_657147 [Wilcoxina mikolae CBS 423.85]
MVYTADDPIFTHFTRLGGHGSGAIYILDKDTHDLVAAVKITNVKDLTPTSRGKFQHIFSYFTRDKGFHPSVSNNYAMVGGAMKAIGWRAVEVVRKEHLLDKIYPWGYRFVGQAAWKLYDPGGEYEASLQKERRRIGLVKQQRQLVEMQQRQEKELRRHAATRCVISTLCTPLSLPQLALNISSISATTAAVAEPHEYLTRRQLTPVYANPFPGAHQNTAMDIEEAIAQ